MQKYLADGPSSIALRPESEAVLKEMADEILQQTISDFEEFREKRNRNVDTAYWKPVQRVDHWQMYQDRRAIRESPRMIKTPRGGYSVTDPNQSVPKFLIVGKVPGTVGDFQYGDLTCQPADWHARAMFVGDNLVHTKILCTLEEPTLEKPYQSCFIIRLLMGNTIIPFVDVRDIVMIFRMGMTEGKDGEQIGYFIAHSVDIRETLTNNGVVRAKGSFCYLRRQLDANFVELYHTGYMATMGSLPEIASSKAVSMFLATSALVGEAGISRKLHWMMQKSFQNKSSRNEPSKQDCAGRCGSGKSWISHGICILCRQQLCGHCKVRRRIILHLDRDALKAKSVSFCKGCVLAARRVSADVCIRKDLKASIGTSAELTIDSLALASSSVSDVKSDNTENAVTLSFEEAESSPKSGDPTNHKNSDKKFEDRTSSGDIIATL